MLTTTSKYTLVICMVYVGLVPRILCSFPDGYQMAKRLQDEILGADRYSPDLRPVRNRSDLITVSTSFTLMRVVEIDDVEQKFVANGFVLFCWKDELLTWNPEDYNGTSVLTPLPSQIWKPRVVLLNTLQERDPFEDTPCPTVSLHSGELCWAPGALLTVSCHLDMTKYPFDTQRCSIIVNFQLDRRPEFYVSNIILPVVFMSFLNLLVFLIPNESGEKISYGITVLLAMAVFMSMVSTMMPRSSDTRPKLTTYFFILLIGSTLSVTASIVTVWFHFRCQNLGGSNLQTHGNKAFRSRKEDFYRSSNGTTTAIVSFQPQVKVSTKEAKYVDPKQGRGNVNVPEKTKRNTCKMISKQLDKICFLIFFTLWVGVNVWYVITVMI